MMIGALQTGVRRTDPSARATLLESVGRSLTSLSGAVFVPHSIGFAWKGSNVDESDIETLELRRAR